MLKINLNVQSKSKTLWPKSFLHTANVGALLSHTVVELETAVLFQACLCLGKRPSVPWFGSMFEVLAGVVTVG